jgi:DNA polymerase-3 subunit delta'
LAQSGVLETLTNFLKIISQKQADIGQLHFLAGQLAPAAKSGEYALFMDLIYDHIVDNARTLAVNDQVSMDRVSKWAAIWDKTREANMRAETWNMDKKQVILDLFNDLRAA